MTEAVFFMHSKLHEYCKKLITRHAYQSLSCVTAINTIFSELFSPKRVYVKYKNAILSHKHVGCSFRT